jgi:hypothetical protein
MKASLSVLLVALVVATCKESLSPLKAIEGDWRTGAIPSGASKSLSLEARRDSIEGTVVVRGLMGAVEGTGFAIGDHSAGIYHIQYWQEATSNGTTHVANYTFRLSADTLIGTWTNISPPSSQALLFFRSP